MNRPEIGRIYFDFLILDYNADLQLFQPLRNGRGRIWCIEKWSHVKIRILETDSRTYLHGASSLNHTRGNLFQLEYVTRLKEQSRGA